MIMTLAFTSKASLESVTTVTIHHNGDMMGNRGATQGINEDLMDEVKKGAPGIAK